MAGFSAEARTRPAKAIAALADFGSQVTRTFNERLSSHYGGDALRPLGQILFAKAAHALNPEPTTAPTASFEIIVVADDADFPADKFLKGESPTEHVVVAERLVRSS